MSAYTDIDICNGALALIGAAEIASFTDGSTEARASKRLYPVAKEAMLASWPWDFATLQLDLGPPLSSVPIDYRYSSAHALPAGWGWVRSVIYPSGALIDPWRIFGNTVQVYLTQDVQPIGEISFNMAVEQLPLFWVDAMIFEMAARLCGPVTGKADLMQNFRSDAELHWARARRQSTMMKTPNKVRGGRFVRER